MKFKENSKLAKNKKIGLSLCSVLINCKLTDTNSQQHTIVLNSADILRAALVKAISTQKLDIPTHKNICESVSLSHLTIV